MSLYLVIMYQLTEMIRHIFPCSVLLFQGKTFLEKTSCTSRSSDPFAMCTKIKVTRNLR